MALPRCGNKDHEMPGTRSLRKKRYALQGETLLILHFDPLTNEVGKPPGFFTGIRLGSDCDIEVIVLYIYSALKNTLDQTWISLSSQATLFDFGNKNQKHTHTPPKTRLVSNAIFTKASAATPGENSL